MYKCETCGILLDEPGIKKEMIGEYMGSPAMEIYAVCPCCGHDELIPMNLCQCGQPKEKSADWCDDCKASRDEIIASSIMEVQRWTGMGYKDSLELLKGYFEEL